MEYFRTQNVLWEMLNYFMKHVKVILKFIRLKTII